MLAELHIRHYALVEDVTVRLGSGLNLLTGETGAGKSILVDALTLLLGARGSGDDVRRGEERAIVTARFDLAALPAVVHRLAEGGIEAEGAELIIAREVQAGGRTRAYVNGRPVTVGMLRELGEELVEVYGQHEGLRLLRPQSHLDLLDLYAGSDVAALRREVEAQHAARRSLRAEAEALREGSRRRQQRMEMLRHQIAEIDSVRPQPGEEEGLEARRLVLAHAARLGEDVDQAYRAIYEGENNAAVDQVGKASALLRAAEALDPSLGPQVAALEEAAGVLAEVARGLRRYADALEADPRELAALEDRLAALRVLVRKYGTAEEGTAGVLRGRESAAQELDALERADDRAEGLDAELGDVERRLGETCARLSRAREAAGTQLAAATGRELAALAMAGGALEVEIARTPDPEGVFVDGSRVAVGPRGADQVQFLIAPNRGEPARPLARIASGGELSRIMLALRTVLVAGQPVPTLIFDEVDAGVGAGTGEAVGERLRRLAAAHQVICITHLPQLASLADIHLQVYKYVVNGRTRIGVRPLEEEARIEEIARMLGGRQNSRVAREHAQELLRVRTRARRREPAARSKQEPTARFKQEPTARFKEEPQ